MPREQINTPATRMIIPMLEPDGSPSESKAHGWWDPMTQYPAGTVAEPTAVLSIGWSAAHESIPGDGSMQLIFQLSADEVLRKAEIILHNRSLEYDLVAPTELPAGTLPAIVEYPPEVVTFESVVITRPEAQKLIATVRRARNAVFGTDE